MSFLDFLLKDGIIDDTDYKSVLSEYGKPGDLLWELNILSKSDVFRYLQKFMRVKHDFNYIK